MQEFYTACTIGGILSCGLTHTAGDRGSHEVLPSDLLAVACRKIYIRGHHHESLTRAI